MKGKKLIYGLYQLLKLVLYINIVLSGGVLGFQIINFFRPEKSLITSYLGKFTLDLNAKGLFQSIQHNNVAVYFENMAGMPSLGVNIPMHGLFVFIFTIAVAGVTLFYNYKFYKMFEILNASVKQGTPFTHEVSKLLKEIAVFSIAIFIVGSLLSILKLWLITDIIFNNFVAHPVYDNQLLNFLWFGLGMYILNEIYNVGLELKKEQDLTI